LACSEKKERRERGQDVRGGRTGSHWMPLGDRELRKDGKTKWGKRDLLKPSLNARTVEETRSSALIEMKTEWE